MSEVSGVTEGVDFALGVTIASLDSKEAQEDIYPAPYEAYPLPTSDNYDKIPSLDHQLKLFLTKGGPKKRFTHLLSLYFGEALVDRVMKLDQHSTLPNRLEKAQCLQLLGGIGHVLTFDDLENYFAELKSGSLKTEILKYAQIPSLRMWWSQTAAQLPNFWINHLVELFRNPLQFIDPNHEFPLGFELEEAGIHKRRSLSYTYYDYAIKKLMKEGDRSRPEFYLSHRELLAKFISYGDTFSTQKGMIIPVFNENTGQVDYYQLEAQVHLSGLHGYFLTPRNKDAGLPALFTFRGTDGGASKHRDLDPKGVGKQVFETCAPQIVQILENYAKNTVNPRLELIGHSLGAADCQRTLVELVKDERASLFQEIKLFAFCSPKLDTPTIELWQKRLNQIADQEKKPILRFSFSYHQNDIITWTGNANLKGTNSYFIQRSYLIVKSDSGISDTMLHHTAPFFRFGNFDFETDKRSFQFVQSYSQEDLDRLVHKLTELENTSSWYISLKSYFVEVETIEQIRQRIELIKQEQARFEEFKEKDSEQSWFVWSALGALNYTLQPIAYYTYGWLIGAGPQKSKTN
ncbi:MAG: hypothetical protein KDK59_10270 [Simkania sp.]|nr:hypothetical protein [Simkania sp.]